MILPVPKPKRNANGYSTPTNLPNGYHRTKIRTMVSDIIAEIVLNRPIRSDSIPGRNRPKAEPLEPVRKVGKVIP